MKKIVILLVTLLLVCSFGYKVNASTINDKYTGVNILTTTGPSQRSTTSHSSTTATNSNGVVDLSHEKMTCEQLLGKNLVKVLHVAISAVRVGAAIAAIIIIMLAFLPVISSGDASEMKKAVKKTVSTVIVLILIEFIPLLAGIVGKIAGFDLSCL